MKIYMFITLLIPIIFITGCQSNHNIQQPSFKIYDLEMQKDISYDIDALGNVIYIPKLDGNNDYTLKITPPKDLTDLSEVKVWCNGILFTNGDMFYSNGREIYVTLPKGKRITTKISVQWKYNQKAQDYYVTYK